MIQVPLSPLAILLLGLTCGLMGLCFLHLIAINVRNEVFVHERRVSVNELRIKFASELAKLYGIPMGDEEIIEVGFADEEDGHATRDGEPADNTEAATGSGTEGRTEPKPDRQPQPEPEPAAA